MKFAKVTWGSSFLRTYKKISRQVPDFDQDFKLFLKEFCQNPLRQKYKFHKLKGQLKGLCAVKIKYDLRLIFEYAGEGIILIDIGKHDEVY